MNSEHSAGAWDQALIGQAHALYGELTGQRLGLHLERQRQWALLLVQGHSLDDLRHVISYLQREIRAGRRNVGALKLSNLLQLDRFEEDLQISRVRVRPEPPPAVIPPFPQQPPLQDEQARQRALAILRQFRASLR